jgi:hypothetical protein
MKAKKTGKRAGTKPDAKRREKKDSPKAEIAREPNGRFLKGVSGNPGGNHVISAEIRELARGYGSEAIERLVHWMRSDDSQASLMAAKILLDRGYGKAIQPLTNPNGGALVNINLGSEPVRTPEQLQAIYTEFMRNPAMDVSALKIDIPPRPALEHQAKEPQTHQK